jgi:hypothetical protein
VLPNVTKTWCLSLRLPINRCTGNGNSLRSVGVTMIPSAKARAGWSSRSTISSLCLAAKCSSQIAFTLAIARSEFDPNVAALATIWLVLSSNATNTPASCACCAPLTSAWSAKTVFPQPGPPMTRVVRSRGSPPSVISSKPWIPVSIFVTGARRDWIFLECP